LKWLLIKEGLENAGDKIKAGAKAVANKIKDPDKDLWHETSSKLLMFSKNTRSNNYYDNESFDY